MSSFHQGNLSGCPREPWHDLHSKIDGPAAYDVLTNFEERWLKAAKPSGIKKFKTSYDDALLRIDRIPDILGVSDTPTVGENDPEAWHVQVRTSKLLLSRRRPERLSKLRSHDLDLASVFSIAWELGMKRKS